MAPDNDPHQDEARLSEIVNRLLHFIWTLPLILLQFLYSSS
uniref:Uncharacterized protein n=1 Tax=Anguilla anguilla TaxID=7936 RepID=A0A0E9PUV8_ANGAN